MTDIYFTNHGKRWTDEQLNKLKSCFQEGMDIRDMCDLFRRTAGGISSRLKVLGLIPAEIDYENYEDYLVGWREYATCPKWTQLELEHKQNLTNKKSERAISKNDSVESFAERVLAEIHSLREEIKSLREAMSE